MTPPLAEPEVGRCILHLLDSAQGHPVQTWKFSDCAKITIGRAPECDIGIVDPQVSRLHAELVYQNFVWKLISLGRNGTIVDGERIDQLELIDHTVFQLGGTGPTFKFGFGAATVSNLATLDQFDPDTLNFLAVDEQGKAESVREIADGDSFKALQEQSRRLKEIK